MILDFFRKPLYTYWPMITFSFNRHFRFLMAAVALVIIASMASFECFKIIHIVSEADCPEEVGGNVVDCPYCTIFTFLFGETANGFDIPGFSCREIIVSYDEPSLHPLFTASNCPARSPPFAS